MTPTDVDADRLAPVAHRVHTLMRVGGRDHELIDLHLVAITSLELPPGPLGDDLP